MSWEMVIGLEVHMELSTKSKIFCACASAFGEEPNTHCCPTCLGLPGALPHLNQQAVRYAVMAGLALHCTIRETIAFDRKNYFYPDLPKAYQITQYRKPIGYDGKAALSDTKTIGIEEIHLEEDAGKLLHYGDRTICDYNRSGVPLLEIVTCPDFRDENEVCVFLEKLRHLFQYLNLSDGKIQEGSMRADVNISLHAPGTALGQRIELKNIGSFRAIKEAIQYERLRQSRMLNAGTRVLAETRGWDEEKKETFLLRKKESVQDYRYFPEPDIPDMMLDPAWVEEIRNTLPELPEKRYQRYQKDLLLPADICQRLISSQKAADLFDQLVLHDIPAHTAAKWILHEAASFTKGKEKSIHSLLCALPEFAELIQLTEEKKINRQTAREVCTHLCESDFHVRAYIEEHNLWQTTDHAETMKIAEGVVAKNEKAVADITKGKAQAMGFLIGQCMKESHGRGNPETFRTLLMDCIKK